MKTKENRIKNYLKLGVFLFGITLLLWNCEKDNQIQEESLLKPRFKVSLISKTEIAENKKLTKRLSVFSNSKNNFAKEVHSSEYNFTVDTNLAKYVENNDGSYHSYTFKVLREQSNGLLENILASLQLDGTYKLFLIKYELSEEGTIIESTNKVQVEIIEDAAFLENLFAKSNCHLEFKCVETCKYGYCHSDSECDDVGALYEVKVVCPSGGASDNGTGAGTPVENPDDDNDDSGNSGGNETGGSGVGDNEQFPDTTSPLTCADGYELYNGNCVPICGRNSTRNVNNGGSCECDEGFIEVSDKSCFNLCEMAFLARDVENTSNGNQVTGTIPLPTQISGGWELNTTLDLSQINLTDSNSGLNSAVYQKFENGEYKYLYVTEGTHDLQDLGTDFSQIWGGSDQYSVSVENARKLNALVGNNSLYFVGHSLGGGLASANALATGRDAFTYNAAGLSNSTKNLYNSGLNPLISATIVRGEFVDTLQSKFGLKAEGIKNYVDYESSQWINFLNRVSPAANTYHQLKLHLIQSVLTAMGCE